MGLARTADVRLDQLRQGIQAGGCGDGARQAERQFGIDHRQPGQHGTGRADWP